MSEVAITLSGRLSRVILANARMPTSDEASQAWQEWRRYLLSKDTPSAPTDLAWEAQAADYNADKFMRSWITEETSRRLRRIAEVLAMDADDTPLAELDTAGQARFY